MTWKRFWILLFTFPYWITLLIVNWLGLVADYLIGHYFDWLDRVDSPYQIEFEEIDQIEKIDDKENKENK